MSFPVGLRQRFSLQVTLGSGEGSHTILAGGSEITIVVINAKVTCLVSDAMAIYVGDTSGTVKAISLAASFPIHGESAIQLLEGLPLTKGEDLIIKAAAAGLSFHTVVEGYVY